MRAVLAALFMAGACAQLSAAVAGLVPLKVTTASGVHVFQVEVMRDDAELRRGLMYRRSLAADHGMLFDFGREEGVLMWMKNTYIPLDMAFIRADGTVHHVAARTTPLSTRTISSGGPVRYVLEVPAGTARRTAIVAGSKVSLPPAR